MGKYYLFIILGISLFFPSCNFFGSLFVSDEPVQVYPDTVVLSTDPQLAEVQFLENDSLYKIESYWTDNNGKWLYRLSTEPYKRGRLHGIKMKFNENGDTLHLSYWDSGSNRDSTIEWFTKKPSQIKQIVHFEPNGNKLMEIYYHENGKRHTDTIAYEKGKREGAINFYDTTGVKLTETYFYSNDELIGVKVHRKEYDQLARDVRSLRASMREDSAKDATELVLEDSIEQSNKNAKILSKTVNLDYKGGAQDVDADIW